MEWETIAKDPEFIKLPPAAQQHIREQFDAEHGGGGEKQGAGLSFDPKKAEGIDESASTKDYLLNRAKAGVADLAGSPVEAVTSAANLVGMAGGAAGVATGLTNPDSAFEPRKNLPGGVSTFRKLLGVNDKTKPSSGLVKFVGDAIEAGVPIIATEGRSLATSKSLLELGTKFSKTAAVSAGAGAGGATAEYYFPDSPIAGFAGTMIGGMLVPSYMMARGTAARVLLTPSERRAFFDAKKSGIGAAVDPFLEYKAKARLKENIEASSKAMERVKEASEIEKAIPGLKFSAGQKTGAAGVIANEQVSAQSSSAAFENYRAVQDANTRAIKEYITPKETKGAPPLALTINKIRAKQDAIITSLRDEEISIRDAMKQRIEAMEPKLRPEERGDILRFQRIREEGVAKRTANALYNEAEVAAKQVNARFDTTAIEQRVKAIMDDPLVGFDPKNAPTVVKQLEAIRQQGGQGIVGPEGKPVGGEQYTFEQIKGLNTAVNQDIIALKSQQGNPNARMQMRALKALKATISGTVANSKYPEVAKKWAAADEFYQNGYARRLLTGTNLRQTLTDNLGNERIVPEKLLDRYIANTGQARQFVSLYGKNPEAVLVMRDHLTDAYQKAVFKNGEFSEKAHAAFMAKHEDVFRVLDSADRGIMARFNNTGRFMQDLSNRQAFLAENQTRLAEGELAHLMKSRDVNGIVEEAWKSPEGVERLSSALGEQGSRALYHKVIGDFFESIKPASPDQIGLDSKKLYSFINKNESRLRPILKQAYGDQGMEYLGNLKKAARALEIQERTGVNSVVVDATVGKEFQKKYGITVRSLWSLYRSALATHRGSVSDSAIAIGGQVATHTLTQRFNEVQQRILSNPDATKALVDAMNSVDASGGKITANGARMLAKVFQSVGWYFVGGHFYMPTIKTTLPAATVGALTPNEKKKDESSTD